MSSRWSWNDILTEADRNSQTAAKTLDEEKRRREKLKEQATSHKSNVNSQAVQMILERRRQEKLAQEQRLQKSKTETKQSKSTKPTSSSTPSSSSKPAVQPKVQVKTQSVKPVKANHLSFDDIMRVAELNAQGKAVPKELRERVEPKREKSTVKSSTPTAPSVTMVAKANKPESSKTIKKTIDVKSSSIKKSTSVPLLNNQTKEVNGRKPSSTIASTNKPKTMTNGTKSSLSTSKSIVKDTKTSTVIRKPVVNGNQSASTSNAKTMNGGTRPSTSNRPTSSMNRTTQNQRAPILPKKRPVLDTDDEEDDPELRDFIVDDDEDDGNTNGFDFRKELHETLKNNYRFDHNKYQRRILDDDDDDLDQMESSFDQIQKEEEYSRRLGLEEDIQDILREQAEKKKRSSQKKKRTKVSN